MSNRNPLKIPVTVNEKFVKVNDNDELADATSYRSLIGSLLFLAKQTPPDILYGFNILSRFMDKPTKAHMQGAKRILRYLHGRSKLKIVYRKQKIQFFWEKVMQTGVAIKMVENQTLIFISNMASTVVLSQGKRESNSRAFKL